MLAEDFVAQTLVGWVEGGAKDAALSFHEVEDPTASDRHDF